MNSIIQYTENRSMIMGKLQRKIEKYIDMEFTILSNNTDVIEMNIKRQVRAMYNKILIIASDKNKDVLDIDDQDIEDAFLELKNDIAKDMCNIIEVK